MHRESEACCKAVAGSFARVQKHGRVRVVPDAEATTKAVTGSTRLDGVPARGSPWPVLWQESNVVG